MKILGIETSCDETAAAVVTDAREVLSNVIYSQIAEHEAYGGVVPEIASRAHIKHLNSVIKKALADANTEINEIDGIAVTAGPGLIGGVIVGVMEAKALASVLKKPFIAVNHLEGHALTARLTDDVEFPFLLLLVSGGHCQILLVKGVGQYELLGQTLDDAVGESFDKLAKMLGLGLPGGPKVEKWAERGDMHAFKLTQPLKGDGSCNFSFSGLKTAVKKKVDANDAKTGDICAVFQYTVGEILTEKLNNAVSRLENPPETLVVAGGVAANRYLRTRIAEAVPQLRLVAPPVRLCTDNAAMIAWAGIEKLRTGQQDGLDFAPRARWKLA